MLDNRVTEKLFEECESTELFRMDISNLKT